MVHRCPFCEWERPAASPTMLEPYCERCGCVLEPGEAAAPRPRQAVPLRSIAGSPLASSLIALVGILSVLGASARAGYTHGGPGLAVGASLFAAVALVALLAPANPRRR